MEKGRERFYIKIHNNNGSFPLITKIGKMVKIIKKIYAHGAYIGHTGMCGLLYMGWFFLAKKYDVYVWWYRHEYVWESVPNKIHQKSSQNRQLSSKISMSASNSLIITNKLSKTVRVEKYASKICRYGSTIFLSATTLQETCTLRRKSFLKND